MLTARRAVAASFLLAQVVSIAHSRFVPTKYFCWSPYDRQTRFHIETTIGGRRLSGAEVEERYEIPEDGWDQRAPDNVLDQLEQYERTYGKGDGASVRVRYSVNGRPQEEWRWPR